MSCTALSNLYLLSSILKQQQRCVCHRKLLKQHMHQSSAETQTMWVLELLNHLEPIISMPMAKHSHSPYAPSTYYQQQQQLTTSKMCQTHSVENVVYRNRAPKSRLYTNVFPPSSFTYETHTGKSTMVLRSAVYLYEKHVCMYLCRCVRLWSA